MIIYVIDTSSLIHMQREYNIRSFLGLWEDMRQLIKQKRLFAPSQVFDEIKRKDDDISQWCKTNKEMFIKENSSYIQLKGLKLPINIIKRTQILVQEYPQLVHQEKEREDAALRNSSRLRIDGWAANLKQTRNICRSERMLKEDIEEIKSLEIDYEYSVLIGMLYMFKKLQQRIKQACEFYLRYFKCPEKLVEDFPEHKKKVEQLCVKSEIFPNLYHVTLKYNEWLFKLAFRGVLDE